MMNENVLYEAQLIDLVNAGAIRLSDMRPSAWTESNIIMGDPFPGPYRYSKTPYVREIIDCLAPDHPARWIAVMKGLQIGISAGLIIPALCYIIKEQPGRTAFTVGAPDLIDKATEKLDLAIDGANLRPFIRPQVQRVRNQKSGDTDAKKDFTGGYILIWSASNHKNWRDVSLKYGFFDDFEAAKSASKESGDTRKLIEGRFAAYKDTHKIYYVSTPELAIGSNIEPAYLLGDQRKYLIPCPCCGSFIEIKWTISDGTNTGGVYWKLDNHDMLIPESVGYVCQSCAGFFKDNNKQKLLNEGYWNPTATPSQPGYYSYHISSLYAPAGMYDWKHYVNNYLEACPPNQPRKESLWKTFKNTTLGETYEPVAEELSANAIQRNQRSYTIGTVPEAQSIADGNGRIVLLTCSADMNGTIKDHHGALENDARLDWEIVAHAESGATYSVQHGSVGTFIPRENQQKVKVDRAKWSYVRGDDRCAWDEFDKILEKAYPLDNGEGAMHIYLTGLDSGNYTKHAYNYVDTTNNFVVALKGEKEEKFTLNSANAALFREGSERANLYILKVGMYKDQIAECMNLNWNDKSDCQPSGFMNFPQPDNGLYTYNGFFKHFEAEHRTTVTDADGATLFRWVKKGTAEQNHFFDCRVYNLAIRDITVQLVGMEHKLKKATWREFVKIVTGK